MPAEVGVVEAAEELGRPGALAADNAAAMRAGVEERAGRAGAVAHQDHWTPADLGGDEVARVGDLRFMAGIEPRAIEDLAPLLVQDRPVSKDAPIDAKDASRA